MTTRISGRLAGASRRLATLVLLALAWTQLVSAAHQFDHPVAGFDDVCLKCAQLERHDDALVTASNDEPRPIITAFTASPPQQGADRQPLAARQRGPPTA